MFIFTNFAFCYIRIITFNTLIPYQSITSNACPIISSYKSFLAYQTFSENQTLTTFFAISISTINTNTFLIRDITGFTNRTETVIAWKTTFTIRRTSYAFFCSLIKTKTTFTLSAYSIETGLTVERITNTFCMIRTVFVACHTFLTDIFMCLGTKFTIW